MVASVVPAPFTGMFNAGGGRMQQRSIILLHNLKVFCGFYYSFVRPVNKKKHQPQRKNDTW
jgi:hypothetical protein